MAYKVPPLLFEKPWHLGMHEISILGLTGCIVAILVAMRLLRAIGKSGHLDQKG